MFFPRLFISLLLWRRTTTTTTFSRYLQHPAKGRIWRHPKCLGKKNKTKQKGILFLASIPVIEYVEQFLMTVEDPPCVEREKREERKEEEAGRVNPSELGVRQCGSPLTACSSFFLSQLSALSFDWCIHCVCAHSVQTDVNKYGNDCCCCCCCSCLICACCYHYTSRQFSYLL